MIIFIVHPDGGYAEASPTEDLVSAYEMADGREFSWSDPTMKANPYVGREPRFYASILYNGAPWKGQTLYTYEGCNDGYALGGGTTCTGYYMRKLFDENLPKNGIRATDLTYYYMRSLVDLCRSYGRTRGYSCSIGGLE